MSKPNKTQMTDVDVTTFIDGAQPPIRQEEARTLVAQLEAITGMCAKMWGPSLIGFGSYAYKYESGREGVAPIIGFSPRKPQLVFYGLKMSETTGETLARLGKHSLGKGCLYIKKLTDIDQSVLGELVSEAWAAHNKKTAF
jgi:hypothetical protein